MSRRESELHQLQLQLELTENDRTFTQQQLDKERAYTNSLQSQIEKLEQQNKREGENALLFSRLQAMISENADLKGQIHRVSAQRDQYQSALSALERGAQEWQQERSRLEKTHMEMREVQTKMREEISILERKQQQNPMGAELMRKMNELLEERQKILKEFSELRG